MMTEASDERRLVYVNASDLDRWQCRPVGTIEMLDLADQPVGRLDGIVIDRASNTPVYIAVRSSSGEDRASWFLVAVGDAWFDETSRAVRIDAPRRERIPFDPDEFARMSREQADEYERRVLATCCPEVGFHRDGRPDYARLALFKCPVWLKPPLHDHEDAGSPRAASSR
jgi:hypothetical protein